MRFELTTSGTAIRRSSQLSYFRHQPFLSTVFIKKCQEVIFIFGKIRISLFSYAPFWCTFLAEALE